MEKKFFVAKFYDHYTALYGANPRILVWEGVETLDMETRWDVCVVPYPGAGVAEPVFVQRRLFSTRGGKYAKWFACEEAKIYLNQAPYQPVFRGWVVYFSWAPPLTAQTRVDRILLPRAVNDTIVRQEGSGVLNWTGYILDPNTLGIEKEEVGLPTRGHLRELLKTFAEKQKIDADHLTKNQGNLHGVFIDNDSLGKFEEAARHLWPYKKTVFNHYLVGGNKVGVLAQYGPWFLVRTGELILSPDHPPLGTTEEMLRVFYHPIPQGGEVD